MASDQWLSRDQGLSPGTHKGLYPVSKHMRALGAAFQLGSGRDLIAAPGRPRANGPLRPAQKPGHKSCETSDVVILSHYVLG